jgi:SAM-dependent methyltransferase
MILPDFEYRGLMAEAWDVLRGDTSNWSDRSFYLEAIQRIGQPVLDVGCGTGRLLLDYLAHGIDIDGVDNSPDMLDLCRHKAGNLGLTPNLYGQYMESLELLRLYRTILVPSSSLQLIIKPDMAAQAAGRLHDHLLPGGAVVAPFMTLWKEGDPLETQEEASAVRPEDGAEFRKVAHCRYDPDTGCEHTDDLYQKVLDGRMVAEERHQRSPATRSYTQAEARLLFEQAGFARVELLSGFTFETVKPADTLFTVIAKHI